MAGLPRGIFGEQEGAGMSNSNEMVLDADLQEIAQRAKWLGELPKWCAWEHLLHDDVMALIATVQAQRDLLNEWRGDYGITPAGAGP